MSVPKDPFGWTNATVVPPRAGPGRGVDGLAARGHHGVERHPAVGDPVADVVQALAPLLERLGHGGVVPRGREELDVALGHLQQRFLHAVALDDLPVLDGGTEGPLVVVDGGLEVVDRDGDVVDLGELGRCHVSLRDGGRA